MEGPIALIYWEKDGECDCSKNAKEERPREKCRAEKGEERCQEEDGKSEIGSSGISNEKLTAKLGLCQHVLPASGRNDGLAHLPFGSGKFPLHPVCYELTGICLIAFATRLAEIRALLHHPGAQHLAARLAGRLRGSAPAHPRAPGREGWSRAALFLQASRNTMPERSQALSQKIPAATSHRGGLDAGVAHAMRQASSGCFTSRGRCLSPG